MTWRGNLARGVVASLLGAASISPAPAAKLRVCQTQEQTYEQIKPTATTLEVNAALFSAADKRCVALARRLLADGRIIEGARPASAPCR